MKTNYIHEMEEIIGPITEQIFQKAGLTIQFGLPSLEVAQQKLKDVIDKDDNLSWETKQVRMGRCLKVLYKCLYSTAEPIVPWFYECSVCGNWLTDAVSAPDGHVTCRVCITEYIDEHLRHPHTERIQPEKFKSNQAMNAAVLYHRKHFARFQPIFV
ncbi:MAG: hypothetical protein EOP45_22130 [Sphingobacteriaceae bacterium]|nr:MAG: hypothetical protein EOP45_22130 [Sphingobacteriaceae bacterium]